MFLIEYLFYSIIIGIFNNKIFLSTVLLKVLGLLNSMIAMRNTKKVIIFYMIMDYLPADWSFLYVK